MRWENVIVPLLLVHWWWLFILPSLIYREIPQAGLSIPVRFLLGTLLYSIVTIIVYLFFPNRPVQESVAKAFCALGNYLDAKSEFF